MLYVGGDCPSFAEDYDKLTSNCASVAPGVPLTDALANELFQTGKTKYKVEGFKSKAGNLFDACLKFENDSILFDFDNPGAPKEPEEDKKETSEPEQTEDQNVLDTLENKEQ